jgi:proline dehydrogenase
MVDIAYLIERKMAGRWIAGPTAGDALKLASKINRHKIGVLIDYLGEEFTAMSDIADAVGTYIMLINEMAKERIHGDISVKPTSIGLRLGQELFESNLTEIVEHGRKMGVFVWLDMEAPDTIDATIEVYLKLVKTRNIGICIQSYLKRSEGDLARVVKAGGIVRLVKGAYAPVKGKSFGSRSEAADSYRRLMGHLFERSGRFMIATHDGSIIEEAIAMNKRHRRNVTYAMLAGINNPLALSLARRGEKVALYVPFGKRWFSYSYRRLREGGHIPLLVKSVLTNQRI